jgi:hypothetical protein
VDQTVMGLRRIAPWAAGMVMLVIADAALTQSNLDAGKTSAQIFADTCASCHRRAQEIKRTSASFLRSHYMTGAAEADAMARYLAGIPGDPKAIQKRTPPGSIPTTTVGRPAGPDAAKDQAREQAKRAQAKGETRTPVAAVPEVAPPAPEPEPPPPAREAEPALAPAPPPKVLEPFEE